MQITKEQFDLLYENITPIVEKILKERYNPENFIDVKEICNGIK